MATPRTAQVTFWGAAHTVTGSMHLVETAGKRLLLDCGLYQGRRAEAYERNHHFPFDAARLDAVVLSHAHIDHCGNLPTLVRAGFDGPIYCTPATRDLAAVMLADSAKIQSEDAYYLNRKRERGEPKVQPLYDARDVPRTTRLMRGVPYGHAETIAGGIELRLSDAGHLLGSAMVHLAFTDRGTDRSITFTGDVGRRDLPILRDPAPVPPADLLISECTYGGRDHAPVEQMGDQLAAIVSRTVERGGKVLVPAFSLGRTQTVLYVLQQVIQAGKLAPVPVFVDSPLAAAATEVFRLHPECFDEETTQLLYDEPDLFAAPLVTYTRTVEQSMALNERREPCVIIASSGMCESGRILHHLKHNLGDARNAVLIVGYQAPHTLGKRLVEHQPEVRIHDQTWPVRAEVVTMNGFSSHAGRSELLSMLAPLADQVEKVRLVHGDPDQAAALEPALRAAGFADVAYPDRGSVTMVGDEP